MCSGGSLDDLYGGQVQSKYSLDKQHAQRGSSIRQVAETLERICERVIGIVPVIQAIVPPRNFTIGFDMPTWFVPPIVVPAGLALLLVLCVTYGAGG
jgi:hypothetical protein